ncbi:MAG: hypothetical protein HC838_10030 [Spirulinaceae cyanobacterium RM2_2_10]|nr:hypothetical protein [Spirulinaceae cyanobacterium SM2_1_0]NJO20303.1 hypothetical protein [Spirulinaceae cyanobacterium RM2_2_10]
MEPWGYLVAVSLGLSSDLASWAVAKSPRPPLSLELAGCADDVTCRLRSHGFDDPAVLRDFLNLLRVAAHEVDQETLVNLVNYPLTLYDQGIPQKTYTTPQELRQDFAAIFTPAVLDAMRDARYEFLFVNAEGAMLGNGEVWLRPTEAGIRIYALNP